MPSIIFFDIDGTIVTEDERSIIPESASKAIAETRNKKMTINYNNYIK